MWPGVQSRSHLPLKSRAHSRQGHRTSLRQRSNSLGAVGADAAHARIALDAVADDYGISFARRRHVEVLERDVLADCVGVRRARQTGYREAVFPARVAREILE